ncbi:MAG: nucleotidyltransferase domain-containing protein [Chloroflexota bacterium]
MVGNKELIEHLRRVLPDILAGTPITLAYLYGSMAVGQSLPSSDVDIALVLDRPQIPLQPDERAKLEFGIEEALEQQGIPNADVRVIDDLPLDFRGQVAIRGVRLYSRNEVARVEFETRTWKEYLDFEPVAWMMRQALLNDIRQHGLVREKE